MTADVRLEPESVTGPPGPPGPPGPSGEAGTNDYVHPQPVASAVWTIEHDLGAYPSIVVMDTAGTVILGSLEYVDENTAVLTFTAPFSGDAYCNL